MPMMGSAYGAGGGSGRETYTQFLQRSVQEAQQQAEAAKQISDVIQAQAGGMPGADIPGMAETGIRELLTGGMSPQEKLGRRQKVTEGFKAATGKYASRTGKAGFYAPGSVGQAVMGQPARGLAMGLGGLEAEEQRARLESVGKGTQAAAGLYQYPFEAAKAAQTGYGDVYRRLQSARTYGQVYGRQPQQYGGQGTRNRFATQRSKSPYALVS